MKSWINHAAISVSHFVCPLVRSWQLDPQLDLHCCNFTLGFVWIFLTFLKISYLAIHLPEESFITPSIDHHKGHSDFDVKFINN